MVSVYKKNKGAVIWLTGLSGAGKSTIAQGLCEKLKQDNRLSYILDGDKVRTGLSSDLGFSHEDRTENIRRIGEVAKLFCDAGLLVVVAFISPYCADRNRVREILNEGEFVEVFVDCPLEECEKRDPKGLYQRARSGEIGQFTGISDPYEAPLKPEVHLRTDECSPEECIESILQYLNISNIQFSECAQ